MAYSYFCNLRWHYQTLPRNQQDYRFEVGLSDREETTSHRVSKEMQRRRYRIIPVNPAQLGGQILGETVHASLQEIPSVDINDVYRRSVFAR